MSILFVVHYPELYGSIRSLLNLVLGLKSYDIVPFFIVPAEGSLSEFLGNQGIRYAVLSGESWVSEKPVPIKEKVDHIHRMNRFSRQIGDYIEQWQIDLVYTNTFVTPAGLIAARRSHIPHIWHIREFGDLDFGLRFIYFLFNGYGEGHIQSVILASLLIMLSVMTGCIAFVSDLLAANRKQLEELQYLLRKSNIG